MCLKYIQRNVILKKHATEILNIRGSVSIDTKLYMW